ncbi:hypothetical protein PTKIN_Ptkin04bG0098900 [Pterospermum kingtungense]
MKLPHKKMVLFKEQPQAVWLSLMFAFAFSWHRLETLSYRWMLSDEYSWTLVASADNVGSNQLQNIRKGLRGDSVVLMRKNTMIKRSIRMHGEKIGNHAFLNLIHLLQNRGNVGLIFTKGDFKEVSEEVAKYKALNIPTKINKSTVEIITLLELIKKGDKVRSFEAALLVKLGI